MLKERESEYKHATNLEEVFDPEKKFLSNYDIEKGGSTGKLPQFNESLLMTVNLSGRKVSQGAYTGSPGNKFFDDLFFSLFSRPGTGLFRYGLIRILAWLPDVEKMSYIPRTVDRRMKQTIILENTADVTEIVGSSLSTKSTKLRRWPHLDMEEHGIVNARVKAIPAYEIPKSRLDEPLHPELLGIEPTVQNLRTATYTSNATWVSKFLELGDHLKKEEPDFYKKYGSGRKMEHRRGKTPLQKKWALTLRNASTMHNTHMRAVELVHQARRLFADWQSAIREANGDALDPDVERQLQTRADENHSEVKALNRSNIIWAEKALDDCRGLEISPHILAWDQREAHPLIVHDGEFEPSNRQMALLDVFPRANLLLKLDTHDKMICFRHIMAIFSKSISRTVAEALKALVHEEGLKDFVKTISGIHNPTKGGWYDLTALRLRALPADMFVEIAVAYEKWPFRPSIETILMLSADSEVAYGGSDDDMH